MPHQCTHCSTVYPDAAEELLNGCSCGSKFFYYIKQEKYDQLKKEARVVLDELAKADKVQIEKDIRELTGLDEEPDTPVILDIESVRIKSPGKFEIDLVNLFSKQRPIIYKLGEGKYIIDIASSLKKGLDKNKIIMPEEVKDEEEMNGETEERVAFEETESDKEDAGEVLGEE